MALEALKQAEKHTVGVKQTEKAVARQVAAVVYIASDADERVTGRLMQLCRENSVPVENTETMLEIGRACGINVKAAAAAILKYPQWSCKRSGEIIKIRNKFLAAHSVNSKNSEAGAKK